jgi:glucosamine--fructose-6-phosphate aminotransferase (isomerizing)
LYGRGPRLDRTAVIGVSQSGQGEDVVAYVAEARKQGATTVAIVNEEQSPLAQTAEWVLGCQAGPEVSVPATKTVSAQMTLLAMLSVAFDDPGASEPTVLRALPGAVSAAVEKRAAAGALARTLAKTTVGSVIGRGFAFPPALEIALKLKETSYTRAEPFSAADFLHGPVAIVDDEFSAVLIDVGGKSSEAAAQTAEAVRARVGRITPSQASELALEAPVDEPYAAIIALVLGQLLAVELGLALGIDPGKPRGLRKVTSTR